MSEELDLVVQFEHLWVLLLSELVSVSLITLVLIAVVVIIIGVVVFTIKEVVVIVCTVEVGSFNQLVFLVNYFFR